MSREDRLAELLERWEAEATGDFTLTAEDFCQDCPDLLPDFRKLLGKLGPVNAVFAGDGMAKVSVEEMLPEVDAGRYRPLSYHRRGGLGIVFIAEDGEIGRKVALKCMQRLPSTDSAARRRFVSEAEITGKLEHPGIVPVYGLGQDAKGKPYYAMRFIQGETLGEAIDRFHSQASAPESERNVDLRRLLRHFIAVCETMAYAHDRGVIHRDLKPANIMIGPYGETLVVDWGLAKRVGKPEAPADDSMTIIFKQRSDPSIDLSITGMAKGSPVFMSPEQARGEWEHVGPASDIYSLGSTLFTLLAGKKPYEGTSVVNVIDKVKRGQFLAPRVAAPRLPRPLEAIVIKAMALQPADRYASAREFAKDLERWLADEPVIAWREPLMVRSRRWLRRHRTLVTSSVAMLLVGLFSAIAFAAQERRSAGVVREINKDLQTKNSLLDLATQRLTKTNIDLTEAKNTAIRERDRAEDNNDLAQRRLYQFMMYLASGSMNKFEYERAAEFLAKSTPSPGDKFDYRRFEWYRSWYALNRATIRTFKIAANPSSMQVSDDGSILVAKCGSSLIVYRVADVERLLTLSANYNTNYRLSRDGRRLVVSDGRQVEIWNLSPDEKPKPGPTLAPFGKTRTTCIALSNDGRWVVAGGNHGGIRIFETEMGKQIHDIDQFVKKETERFEISEVDISSDRHWIAFNHLADTPVILNLATRQPIKVEVPIQRRDPAQIVSAAVTFSFRGFTDSGRFFVQFDRDQLWSWPLPSPSNVYNSTNADKRTIPQGARQLWEVPTPGEDPTLYFQGDSGVFGVRTPVAMERPILQLQFPPKLVRRVLSPVPFRVAMPFEAKAFVVLPSGKTLYGADRTGRVVVLDAARAAEPELLLRHPGQGATTDLTFMSDGQLISLSSNGSLLKSRPGGGPEWNHISEQTTLYAMDFPNPSMALSADGKWTALRLKNNIEVVETATGTRLEELLLQRAGFLNRRVPMAFVPGKSAIVYAPERKEGKAFGATLMPSNLEMWDYGQFQEISQTAAVFGGSALQHTARVRFFGQTMRGIPTSTHIFAIAVSPDGKWLAAADRDGFVRLYDLVKFTPRPVREFRASAALDAACFSPDSQLLAAGAVDGTVWIWPVESPISPIRIPAHRGSVNCLMFDRDGKTIISGGSDGLIKFLILELPYERYTIDTGAEVRAMAMAPDELSIAAGDASGYVRLYRAATLETVFETARTRWKESPDSSERIRDLFQAYWGRYLERWRAKDLDGAKTMLNEAIEFVQHLDEKQKIEFKDWLVALTEAK